MLCSYFIPEKSWEVFYRGIFTDKHPNPNLGPQSAPGAPVVPPSLLKSPASILLISQSVVTPCGTFIPRSLSIPALSHITHNQQAEQIRLNEHLFNFIPRQRVTKDYGGTFENYGGTFENYVKMADHSLVFPGYLSWWGISSQRADRTVACPEFKNVIDQVKGVFLPRHIFEAEYLKYPPESKYGNRAFVIEFPNLIESYMSSRVDSVSKAVYLKRAGTLRYKNEICYVVMVVMEEDLQNSDIGALPGINQGMNSEPKFGHNNCIDENGKIINNCIDENGKIIIINPELYFNVSHPFCYINGVYHCWESLAFAFYFPNQSQILQCPKALVTETLVNHPDIVCISKQLHPQLQKWVCPSRIMI